MSERETTRWSGKQKPPGLTPADMQRWMRETTILQAGDQDGIHWAQVTTPGGAECWVALDFDAYRGALVPYAEDLAAIFVYEWQLHDPLILWRFDVVGQRPPALRLVARWSFPDSDPMALPDSLPGPLDALFDQLEFDVVTPA